MSWEEIEVFPVHCFECQAHCGKPTRLTTEEHQRPKRCQVIEPVIDTGHPKADRRMERCYLRAKLGCSACGNVRSRVQHWLVAALHHQTQRSSVSVLAFYAVMVLKR